MLVAERSPTVNSGFNTGAENRKKPRKCWKRAFLIKTAASLIGLVFLNSLIQALVIQKNYEITRERSAIQALERELTKIRVEIAGLTSYDRIQHLAQTELGMKLASPGDYHRIVAAPVFDRNLPRTYNESLWSKFTAWLEGEGKTLANSP
ncbi:MAG: hypothetical protein GX075_01880 [Firmicutes bacterium]|nr:hypothetical protein [Bacillota bacterium]